ncbi:hypothetical protein AHFPHNDE_03706 [Pseudomonas sp. MM227]|uniref:acyltransferase family protein n=1 Tax=Pseudomonas sp. MM227 TaxID=3019968 RepID=UPI00221F1A55|nr:acyltransferase [Pseudomonas sp. MM227]CAI3789997.1 hypothetical protein AHFPHNDE_03706 [Pseudomonas sp. MM227]
MASGQRFHALDSLRGICALAVVLYHLHVVGSVTELAFFRSADLFVDFFFVLSGFVITHAYGARHDLDLRRFFILRTFRLAPLHVCLLGVFIVFEFVKWGAAQQGVNFNKEPFTGMYAPSQIVPNLLLIQAWTPWTENMSFNYPSWSISIEYYMYLIFAAVVLCTSARRRVLAWAGIVMGAAALLYSGAGPFTALAYKGLACFFAGALCYKAFEALRRRVQPGFAMASLLEVVAGGSIVWVLSSDEPNKAMLASALFCLTVTLYAFDAGIVSNVLKTRVFELLGRLSYSIYLTHVIILSVLILLFMVLEKKTGLPLAPVFGDFRYLDSGYPWLNNLLVGLVLLAVIGVSFITYHLIEVNGQKLGRRLLGHRLPAQAVPG